MKKLIAFLTGTMIFVILPLIARGIINLESYFSNTERLLYIISMMVMNILVVLLIPNQGKSIGKGEKLVKKHKFSLLALQILPLCVVLLGPIFDRYQIYTFGEYERIRIVGILCVIVGFVLMNWSVYALGKQFSTDITIQKNHELITTGPYTRIRHPRYLGIILFFVGVAGVFNAVISVVLVVILCGFLVRRVYYEEKIMKTEFKNKREIYVKKTWKIVPFIW